MPDIIDIHDDIRVKNNKKSAAKGHHHTVEDQKDRGFSALWWYGTQGPVKSKLSTVTFWQKK
jgi:hypothetical protein